MFESMYYGYLIMGIGLGLVGVIYGIRLQMRQNFAKKLAKLDTTGNYSHWVEVLGEPKEETSITTQSGERHKTVVWAVPGTTVKAKFNQQGYCIDLDGLVTQP